MRCQKNQLKEIEIQLRKKIIKDFQRSIKTRIHIVVLSEDSLLIKAIGLLSSQCFIHMPFLRYLVHTTNHSTSDLVHYCFTSMDSFPLK